MILTITGQIPSGKNQHQLLWCKGKVVKYPNQRFKDWRKDAARQVCMQAGYDREAHMTPVSLRCEYWPGDHRTRDVSGMLDAIFYLLVYCELLHDDGLIYDVVWKRMAVSKFPKVCLEIGAWKP